MVTEPHQSGKSKIALPTSPSDVTDDAAATAAGDPVLVAALTGPATLAVELAGDWFATATADRPTEAALAFLEEVGQFTLRIVQPLLEAGVNLVVLIEKWAPSPTLLEAWRSAVTPLINVSRFHQAAAVVVLAEGSAPDFAAVPTPFGVCVPEGITVPGPATRLRGVALPCEPKEWPSGAGDAALMVTAGMVPAHCGFAEVHDACRRFVAG